MTRLAVDAALLKVGTYAARGPAVVPLIELFRLVGCAVAGTR